MPGFDFVTDLTVIILLAVMLGVFGVFAWRERLQRQKVERENQIIHKNLNASFTLGGYLLEAHDEESAILAVMRAGADLLGAQGCAFVPFNEWEQSLPALKYGDLPLLQEPGWRVRLLHPATRHACRSCENRQAGSECVLLEKSADAENVYCVPLRCGGREIGVISYLFPAPVQVTEEQYFFLNELVRLTDLALDSMRVHEQEISALRHIQDPAIQKEEITTLLERLLEDIRLAMDIDLALIWVPAKEGLRRPLLLQSVYPENFDEPFWVENPSMLEGVWQTVSRSNKTLSLESVTLPRELASRSGLKLLALPVAWRENEPLGMLLLGSQPLHKFTRRQLLLLRTVSGQAALLIQNDLLMTQLEYQAVLDERTRLAREIHDGLAQTLAFLKMEAARMQSYIAKGDFPSVDRTLQACYRTLSDAYLDARQAIDNLRRAPEEDLSDWLTMTATDFETLTGIHVNVSASEFEHAFQPAVKAQLTRIVQEALTNIRKHAQSHAVSISAFEHDGGIVVEVNDNGRGFSPIEKQSISQHGLRSMRERAESIGADFQIISAPNMGTTVRLQIPIREQVKP
jgi:two-component system nitrate/nitrite sensor histidine kinase NarX